MNTPQLYRRLATVNHSSCLLCCRALQLSNNAHWLVSMDFLLQNGISIVHWRWYSWTTNTEISYNYTCVLKCFPSSRNNSFVDFKLFGYICKIPLLLKLSDHSIVCKVFHMVCYIHIILTSAVELTAKVLVLHCVCWIHSFFMPSVMSCFWYFYANHLSTDISYHQFKALFCNNQFNNANLCPI